MFEVKWRNVLPAAVLLLGCMAAEAKVEVAPVFSDNAVLQRQLPVPVWGKADPGEAVTVKFAGQTKETTAGNDGKWMVKLDPLEASKENRQLTVTGKDNSITVNNVLVGEVWIASGQSNMEQPLWGGNERFRHRNAKATGKEVADKTDIPTLRFVNMPRRWSETPVDNEKVSWNVAKSGDALERASAVAFFFGRELNQELDVPVGILGAYWGGTRIEPWTPPEGFASVPEVGNIARRVNSKIGGTGEYKEITAKVIADYTAWLESYKQAAAKGSLPPVPPEFPGDQKPYVNHQQPTVLYNQMMYSFVPYAVRGGIWYQGESNRGEGMLYRYKMQALLNGWKQAFQNPSLKLYFAQLAPYNYGSNPAALSEIWEAQQAFADNEKDAGMAVINDVGDIRDIHPADKETVGRRLAFLALNRDYGKSEIKADSPRLKSSKVEGNAFVLDFDFVENWKVLGDGRIPHFEVAGPDLEYVPAKAEIRGKQIVVSSDALSTPTNLRYMWEHRNEGKLANEAGLMLGAFRIETIPARQALLDYYMANRTLVYEYNLLSGSGFGDKTKVNYVKDNSNGRGKLFRLTYFAVLEKKDGSTQYVAVTMDPFTQNAKQLGVPVKSAGAAFQQRVGNMLVFSDVEEVKTGKFSEGNIEFWPNNYGGRNTGKVPNASDSAYDFGDEKTNPEVGYGSMQIHNFQQRQTIFAYNKFESGPNADIGIGNRPGVQHTDWTFSGSGKDLAKATLYVFVKEEPRASDAEVMAPVTAKVPEAASMKPVYVYDLLSGSGFGDRTRVNYAEDNSGSAGNVKKVAYFALLKGKDGKESWVFAKMDSFSPNASKLGVPVKSTGPGFQQKVANLEVKTNVEGVKTGSFAEGNIEFWSSNYGKENAAQVPGAAEDKFDFGDQKTGQDPGYGSMQIHNFPEKQTVFAYNNFSAGAKADIGIGNNPAKEPDWTFSGSAQNYASATLYVMVETE